MSGKYILKKLPLNNKVLTKFSYIDPAIVTFPSTAMLKTMGSYLVMCRPMETTFVVCSGD